MSPIGRVFIVLNLILAGGFVFLAGDHLQNQNNWKEKHSTDTAALQQTITDRDNTIAAVEKERDNFNNAKTAFETQLLAAKNSNKTLQDDNKRLEKLTSEQAAQLQRLATLQEQSQTDTRSAIAQAKEAYDASIAAGKAKDEAIRAKDIAQAENRQLKNDIVGLNSTIEAKNASLADLGRDNQEKDLLLSAAYANGFIDAMAAPTLAGTVTNASGRLLTVSVADNPAKVDIQDVINRLPFRFAIFGEDGVYKGDAVAQKYEASANAVLCKLVIQQENATIRTGDRAATNP